MSPQLCPVWERVCGRMSISQQEIMAKTLNADPPAEPPGQCVGTFTWGIKTALKRMILIFKQKTDLWAAGGDGSHLQCRHGMRSKSCCSKHSLGYLNRPLGHSTTCCLLLWQTWDSRAQQCLDRSPREPQRPCSQRQPTTSINQLMAAALFSPQSTLEPCIWQHPLPLLPPAFPA